MDFTAVSLYVGLIATETTTMKKGTKIEYTYAAGKVVQGKVLGPYAADMPNWYLCELTDEHSTYRGGCHADQLRNVDNRPEMN